MSNELGLAKNCLFSPVVPTGFYYVDKEIYNVITVITVFFHW